MPSVLPLNDAGNWGIYYTEDGSEALTFDSFVGLTVKFESNTATDPIERGGFAAYNKVGSPAQLGVVIAKSGTPSELQETIDTVDELIASVDLLDIITPEMTYTEFSLTGADYDRKNENGVGRLLLSLTFVQIQQIETEYSNEALPPQQEQPKNAADTKNKSTGKTAPQPASDAATDRWSKKYNSQLSRL